MSTLSIHREAPESQAIVLPEPRVPISIRVAMVDDLPFIDALQKKHSKMVGFLHLPTLEAKIKAGHVLLAEEIRDQKSQVSHQPASSALTSDLRPLTSGSPVGYCIFQDKYDKHEDCGIFYQVNVAPGSQRGLIGAALVKAALDRAAYGCKLACCWCAQDLEANYFWESLGFVPLAFRTGARKAGAKKGTGGPRIHIFWQRRIREGDNETPYWFPSETSGGALKENRLVLPIPPGTHWSDAKPAVLPGMEVLNEPRALASGSGCQGQPLPPPGAGRGSSKRRKPKPKAQARPRRGLWFAAPGAPDSPEAKAAEKEKKKEPKQRPRFKNDPKLIAAARELRDRWLEQVNADPGMLLPVAGKYDVSRSLGGAPVRPDAQRMLDAA